MALVVGLSAVALLGVVERYALHLGIAWMEEGARFLLVWASLLSAAVVVPRHGHFAVMVVVGLLPSRFQVVLAVAINLLAMAILGVLFVQGVNVTTVMSIQRSPALDLPMSVIYASLPVSIVFMMVFLVADTFDRIQDVAGRGAGLGGTGESRERAS